jgi:hypothetical protein
MNEDEQGDQDDQDDQDDHHFCGDHLDPKGTTVRTRHHLLVARGPPAVLFRGAGALELGLQSPGLRQLRPAHITS